MYNPNLKEERIKAQLKAIGGLGFGFGKHINKLKEILFDDEDIYGYLVGFNNDSRNWEIMLCTNFHLYVLDKNGLFSVGYSQYDIKSFRGLNADSNAFRKYKVTVLVDRKKYEYSECQRGYVDLFRTATNYAKRGGDLPYDFDKTPYLEKIPEKETVYEEPTVEYTKNQQTSDFLENDPTSFLRKEALKTQDGTFKSTRNVFLYPNEKGEGFTYGDNIDDNYLEQAQYFIELAKCEPIRDDFDYLNGNFEFIRNQVSKGDLESVVLFGRKGKLYLLKQELGIDKIIKQDFATVDDYFEYVNRPTEKDFEKQNNMVKNNHISSRFVDFKEDEVTEPSNIETKTDDEEFDFDIDFSKINTNPVEDSGDLETILPNDSEIFDIQDNGKTKMFNLLKEYKELLDIGVLTQTEFDKKKSELLGLND